jgi:hypothetical protein
MTQLGGRQWSQVWTALSEAVVSAMPAEVREEPHLATDAVVAYVDGELSIAAHERATRHLARCALCTAEVAAQRQARAAVRNAQAPTMPPELLAALHAIPHSVELPLPPSELVVDEDGELMVAQRPTDDALPLGLSAPLGSGSRLGSSPPLGSGDSGGGSRWRSSASRRARQGAGVVVSGLVLGALAMAAPIESTADAPAGSGAQSSNGPVTVVPARFELDTGPRDDAAHKSVTGPARAQR